LSELTFDEGDPPILTSVSPAAASMPDPTLSGIPTEIALLVRNDTDHSLWRYVITGGETGWFAPENTGIVCEDTPATTFFGGEQWVAYRKFDASGGFGPGIVVQNVEDTTTWVVIPTDSPFPVALAAEELADTVEDSLWLAYVLEDGVGPPGGPVALRRIKRNPTTNELEAGPQRVLAQVRVIPGLPKEFIEFKAHDRPGLVFHRAADAYMEPELLTFRSRLYVFARQEGVGTQSGCLFVASVEMDVDGEPLDGCPENPDLLCLPANERAQGIDGGGQIASPPSVIRRPGRFVGPEGGEGVLWIVYRLSAEDGNDTRLGYRQLFGE
jgi:hypothetical protein